MPVSPCIWVRFSNPAVDYGNIWICCLQGGAEALSDLDIEHCAGLRSRPALLGGYDYPASAISGSYIWLDLTKLLIELQSYRELCTQVICFFLILDGPPPTLLRNMWRAAARNSSRRKEHSLGDNNADEQGRFFFVFLFLNYYEAGQHGKLMIFARYLIFTRCKKLDIHSVRNLIYMYSQVYLGMHLRT